MRALIGLPSDKQFCLSNDRVVVLPNQFGQLLGWEPVAGDNSFAVAGAWMQAVMLKGILRQ